MDRKTYANTAQCNISLMWENVTTVVGGMLTTYAQY